MKKITEKNKNKLIFCFVLILILSTTAYHKLKDADWEALQPPLSQKIKNAPSIFQEVPEQEKEDVLKAFSTFKSIGEEVNYEKHLVPPVSFETPADWKKQPVEDENKEVAVVFYSASEENKMFSVQVLEGEFNNIEEIVSIIKNYKKDFSFNDLLAEEEDSFFLEAKSIEKDDDVLLFVKIIICEENFYAISITTPEEDFFTNLMITNHIITTFQTKK
jgi:hypothetical protein